MIYIVTLCRIRKDFFRFIEVRILFDNALDSDVARKAQAIFALYLGTLLNGYSFGWSAVALPDIQQEARSDLAPGLEIS